MRGGGWSAWPVCSCRGSVGWPGRSPGHARTKSADVESEMLTGFIAAVRRVDPARVRLASHLIWRAQSGAKKLVRAELAEWARPTFHPFSAAPRAPWGHPDLVLAKAVKQGVLCREDAELIGATRIGGEALEAAAARRAMTYASARQRRRRAEATLATWLTSDEYFSADFVTKGRPSPRSLGVDRPPAGPAKAAATGAASLGPTNVEVRVPSPLPPAPPRRSPHLMQANLVAQSQSYRAATGHRTKRWQTVARRSPPRHISQRACAGYCAAFHLSESSPSSWWWYSSPRRRRPPARPRSPA